MLSINRYWWEHLVPKPMQRRLREVETALRNWCVSPYGAHWLTAARPGGVIRVVPGQAMPVVHLVALGNYPIRIGPQRTAQVGLRTVGEPHELRSGQPLRDGELSLMPEIRIELVSDPALLDAASKLSDTLSRPVEEPALIFSCPAHYLLSPTLWPKKSYVLYQHIFGSGASYPDDGFFYVGVTTRSWQVRWAEHRRAVDTDSPLLFHRRLREEMAAQRVTYIHHKVMGITQDIESLYASEEFLVEGHWHDARRLNMIPGGKSGLRYMREHGMLSSSVVPMPDERDQILAKWLQDHPRKGLPAPWVSAKWKDDAWAIAQICGRDDRLSVEQVQAIRALSATYGADEIAQRIGARNTEQVKRVLAGKTYTRVN